MSPKRPDSFVIALDTLRMGLREGTYTNGGRLAATEIANALNLSATPVREALSRLAGEGLVEDRRGQGFFVPRLAGRDIADLYRLNQVYVGWAFEAGFGPEPSVVMPEGDLAAIEPPPDGLSAVLLSERLFQAWVSRSSRVVAQSHRKLQDQLAACRRFEPLLLPDLEGEVMQLVTLARRNDGDRLSALLGEFHARRIALAPSLASHLEAEQSNRK